MNPTLRIVVFAAFAIVAACAKSPPELQPITRRAALQPFSGPNACADLEAYIENTAVDMMRTQLEQARDAVGQSGYGPLLVEGDLASAEASKGAPADASAAPSAYTTTNNQVQGVDEADFVKNDGTRLFVVTGNKLYAVKSWPAAETSVIGSLAIPGWPREMFLEGEDRAVVFSQIYKHYPLAPAASCDAFSMSCGYSYSNTVLVSVIDVSNMAQMKVLSSYELPGRYHSARKIASSVRVVLSDDFRFPDGVRFYPDYDPSDYMVTRNPRGYEESTPIVAKLQGKYNAMIASNETMIRNQHLEAWLPAATVTDAQGTRVRPQDCGAFSKVNAPTRMGTLSVVTLNLATQAFDQRSILSEPGEIYASTDNLYLATRHWWWWPAPGQEDATYLHKFDITSADSARYVASGTVSGAIVDQFSMDEHAGFFRIVTTTTKRVPDPEHPDNRWGRVETSSRLWVFAEDDGALVDVGRSDELAKGERVMSSRFLGDKGFVVTFRSVDPLFSFDLRDPTQPVLKGELKIPGFSTYMHPIDNDHLLTIGQYIPPPDANGRTDWSQAGLQLQIFDISDLANPKQTHATMLNVNASTYGYSEAMWDHKAFNYFPEKKQLAIPFAAWDNRWSGADYWSRFRSELLVVGVDAQTGFTQKGAISMSDLYVTHAYGNWTYYWTPQVRRSVMADDFVYAVSDAGVRVANVADLAAPLATASFELATP